MDMEIITQASNLPTKIEDLTRFVLVGREKMVSIRAEIRAINKLGLGKEVRQQKLDEGQIIADALLDAEVRLGELMREIPKATKGNQYTGKMVMDTDVPNQTKAETLKDIGFNEKQKQRFETLAANPEIVAQAKAEARENDDIVSRSLVLSKIKSKKKAEEIAEAHAAVDKQTGNGKPVLNICDSRTFNVGEKYDLLLTDPPYSTDVPDLDAFIDSWYYRALDGVKDTGFAYIFIGAYPNEQRAYLNAKVPEHMVLEQILVWTYKNTLGNNPKDRYKLNYQACLFFRGINAPALDCPLTTEQWAVQEINAPDGRQGDRYHAWQKPMEIAERFIRHSTKQGSLVYDPFACTGTFILAAAKLGRNGIGCEIDEANAQIAFDRGCARG